ncbi:cache domain-containing protein, partial [Aliarcobacter lanthieri]|uniref:cache domain-containing protein n=1 Tax=Aliarcobacter lanthieri TaxID=1355374 RepID=UPI003AA858EF
MGNISIKNKLLVILYLVCGGFILLSTIFLFSERNTMLEEKRLKLKNIVELAYSIVEAEYKAFNNGILDEETAKNNALIAINKLRYNSAGHQEYIFIIDDTNPYPKMIQHPINPALNKTTLDSDNYNVATKFIYGDKKDEITLSSKQNLFKTMVEVTTKENSGFVTYLWNKNSQSEDLYEKVSYVKKFKEWGFILGSGIYIDDINEQFYSNIIKSTIITLLILTIIGVILMIISNNILNSIKSFKNGLLGFFAYLNRDELTVNTIKINSN